MAFTTQDIQTLRESLGVGLMDAKRALEKAEGDLKKAEAFLRTQGAKRAEQKQPRAMKEGWIGSYVHANGKEAGLVALSCETDFVSRTEAFRELAHNIALHVVAMKPQVVKPEEVSSEILQNEVQIWREQLAKEQKPEAMIEKIIAGKKEKYFAEVCLNRRSLRMIRSQLSNFYKKP
jgi:elongation factor Ts